MENSENYGYGVPVKVLGPYFGEEAIITKVWDQSYPTQYDVRFADGSTDTVIHGALEVL